MEVTISDLAKILHTALFEKKNLGPPGSELKDSNIFVLEFEQVPQKTYKFYKIQKTFQILKMKKISILVNSNRIMYCSKLIFIEQNFVVSFRS